MKVLGCDGTVVNTGTHGGVLRLIETKLGRPLSWFVCQLHANELPLRHLCGALIGKTMGPKGFAGEIGSRLNVCEKLPVVAFVAFSGADLSVDRNTLSTDQKYLYDIFQSITTGKVSIEIARKSPGKMSHSRWLTTANRILRLYVSTTDPDDNFKMLVEFIMRVYAPMWFKIKVHHNAEDGRGNLMATIKAARNLSEGVKKIAYPVIQRNAFYGHPENIMFAMIKDPRQYVRKLGYHRIKKSRTLFKTGNVRKFKIPTLRFDADEHYDMID